MQTKNSPSGAYFPYYYKGGELFGVHLGSYHSDQDRVIAMMKAEEAFIAEQNRKMGMWIDLYETKLTERVLGELVRVFDRLVSQTSKLAIVGCSFVDRWKLNRHIRKAGGLSGLPVKYFDDPEDAKTWLVAEFK